MDPHSIGSPAEDPTGRPRDRSEATRRLLCLAAEDLVARGGMAQATLRNIAEAAGQRNTAAVSYHFGSVARLLRAVVEMRLRELEGERCRMIAASGGAAALDAFAAWRCMMVPYLSVEEERSPHAHVRFLLHMRVAGQLSDVFAPGYSAADCPSMPFLIDRIVAGVAGLPPPLGRARVSLCAMLYWSAVALFDEETVSGGGAEQLEAVLADVEQTVAGMLGAGALTA